MGPEVFHPGEYAAHGASVVVARVFMSDGLSADLIILIDEREGRAGVLAGHQ